MTPLEVLVASRELISDPAHWCQINAAKDKDGRPIPYFSENAFSFCALGAISHIDPFGGREVDDYLNQAAQDLEVSHDPTWDSYIDFNDNHTHSEVLAMFDLAIEKAGVPVATYSDVC